MHSKYSPRGLKGKNGQKAPVFTEKFGVDYDSWRIKIFKTFQTTLHYIQLEAEVNGMVFEEEEWEEGDQLPIAVKATITYGDQTYTKKIFPLQ